MAAVYPNQPEIASINRPQPADIFGSHLDLRLDGWRRTGRPDAQAVPPTGTWGITEGLQA